ncbi:hypothetical protein COCCADRAFT_31583 [Bipolaris zeicola 26-R-13]|uniref:AA1-like domain-containing protein n=1 Tax=Cochliobolus carbonum (strain 26-R-13) TaxID=930089 RepID=W6XI13_COCC2|nr:uncharacterized protein COCCADRAFT_31583 [Bipolaris zeicola 26-R-13]EUC26687.1 hypothetical protein COCCADRAFT_31583 [Bipolaris zeicola 26-R-13]
MLFNLSFTSLLVGLFAIQTAFAAVVQPLEVRETSNCPKRRFSIQASSGVNSLTGSMSYSVMLVDEKDKPHPEFTSCIFPGTKFQFGAGCKWFVPGSTARITKDGYWWEVKHDGFFAGALYKGDVHVRGNGCTNTQKCKSSRTQQCEPSPDGKQPNCVLTTYVDYIF